MSNPEITRREVMDYFGLEVPQERLVEGDPVVKANEADRFGCPPLHASAASEIAEYFNVEGEE